MNRQESPFEQGITEGLIWRCLVFFMKSVRISDYFIVWERADSRLLLQIWRKYTLPLYKMPLVSSTQVFEIVSHCSTCTYRPWANVWRARSLPGPLLHLKLPRGLEVARVLRRTTPVETNTTIFNSCSQVLSKHQVKQNTSIWTNVSKPIAVKLFRCVFNLTFHEHLIFLATIATT